MLGRYIPGTDLGGLALKILCSRATFSKEWGNWAVRV